MRLSCMKGVLRVLAWTYLKADEASLNSWEENMGLINRSYPGHTLMSVLELQKTDRNGDVSFMEILLCESSAPTPIPTT